MGKAPIPHASRPTEMARLELSRLPAGTALGHVFSRACELSAEALGVERVGVWLFIDGRTALRCADLYERSRSEHSSGTVLRVADFPTYFGALNIRKAVPAEVATTEPWTAELADVYLRPLGITSMLDAGVFVEGQMVGVVCHESVGPYREWTTEARDFAGSVADLLAARIQAAEAREVQAAFRSKAERLGALDKAEALERLAAGVAHDFRNLLGAFLGQGEILAARPDVPDDVRVQGREIMAAAERGMGIAEDLLAFARPAARPPTVADPGELVAAMLPSLRAAAGRAHEVRLERAAPVGKVLLDPTGLARLVTNLVANAREAMPGGGPIEIRLSAVRLEGDPEFTGRYVLLEVADRGVGMSEDVRRRAFEPYFTTKPNGTGLGLAIVRQVVERAGGLVRVEAREGGGTVFRVFFPRIGGSTGDTCVIRLPPEPG